MEKYRYNFKAFDVNIDYTQVYATEHKLASNEIDNIEEFIKYVSTNYKILLIHYWEEFIYDDFIKELILLTSKTNLQLYIFSLNPILHKFLKNERVHCNPTETLFYYSDECDVNINDKDIELLFLNYNRKINRDYIISILYKTGNLYKPSNYISYHNYFPTPKEEYYQRYEKYSCDNDIDFKFLETLKINATGFNVDNQQKNMEEVKILHLKSKFNIICEPFFGLSETTNSYDVYNHFLSRKTVYSLLYKNVFYIHEYNSMFSDMLSQIGFKLFFKSLDEFIDNINDEFYYKDSTIKKLNHNYELVKKLTKNCSKKFENHINEILKNV
jgi:hypothetical protein